MSVIAWNDSSSPRLGRSCWAIGTSDI